MKRLIGEFMRIIIIAMAVMSIVISAPSQRASSARVYREQFLSLRAQVTGELTKFTSPETDRNKPTRQDLLELVKLIHRLDESALQDSNQAADKRPYLLIGQGCIALHQLALRKNIGRLDAGATRLPFRSAAG